MPTADCSFTRYNDMVARTPYLSPGTSKPLAATLREDPTWNLAAEILPDSLGEIIKSKAVAKQFSAFWLLFVSKHIYLMIRCKTPTCGRVGAVPCASVAAMEGAVTQPLGYAQDQQKASEGKAHQGDDQGKPSSVGAGASGREATKKYLEQHGREKTGTDN